MHLTFFFRARREPLSDDNQSPAGVSMPLRIVTAMLFRFATMAVVFASLMSLMWVGNHAGAPDPDSPAGSGIVVHTEIVAVWLPRALLDQARERCGLPVVRSPDELRTCLEQDGWPDPWYALTCRHYQVNGQCSEMTQIRWLIQTADHLDEFQAVMATAARRPPRFEGSDISHPRIEVIPDALQAVEPPEAIRRLLSGPTPSERP
jgi:hypothetical protein